MVQFNFMAKSHTVTQSTFPAPCKKMVAMPGMPAPIDSGFMVNNGTGTPPMMMIQVTDTTTPMWFYCRQKMPKPHCGSGNGMTFSINPNMPGQGAKTQAAFKALAMMQVANTTTGTTGGAAAAAAAAAAASAAAVPAPAAVALNVATPQQQQAGGSTSQQQSPSQQSPSQPQAGGSTPSQQSPNQPQQAGSSTNQNQNNNAALMTQGMGQTNTGGACECSCLCGVNAFPNAMQGIGAMGGGLPGKAR